MIVLSVQNAGCSLNRKRVLQGISFTVNRGQFIGIAGLNGSGKSTLLKMLQRIYVADEGEIHLKGRELKGFSSKELARMIAAVPQMIRIGFDFTAKQMVMLGRAPFLGFLSNPSSHDEWVVEAVMRKTDCLQFADASVLRLSAGELQRVWIALALAQQPEILLLDEPTTSLDLRQQRRLIRLLSALRDKGMTILCASHDLFLLTHFSDRILLLDAGSQIRFGASKEVLSAELLRDLFEMEEAALDAP